MADGRIDTRRCSVLTKSGTQCRGKALPDRPYCAVHSPEAIEGRRRGGVNRSNVQRGLKRLPPTLREVADMLADGIEQTRDGKMKPPVLSAMAAGTSALVKVAEVAMLASQVEEMRRQVADLLAQRSQEGSYR